MVKAVLKIDVLRLRKIVDWEKRYGFLSVEEKFRLFKLALEEMDNELKRLAHRRGVWSFFFSRFISLERGL